MVSKILLGRVEDDRRAGALAGSIERTSSSSPSGTPSAKVWRHRWSRFLTSTSVGAQRVDDRDTDAVQTAGDLVAAAAELAARRAAWSAPSSPRGCPRWGGCRWGCRDRCPRRARRHRAGGSARSGRSSRPGSRRPRCRRSPTPGGAGRARRSSRCTCPGACGRPPGPRAPGSSRRRSRPGRRGRGGRGGGALGVGTRWSRRTHAPSSTPDVRRLAPRRPRSDTQKVVARGSQSTHRP